MRNKKTIVEKNTVSSNKIKNEVKVVDRGSPTRYPLSAPMTISKPSSRSFDAHYAINPLVAAATPLLMVCCKLQNTKQNPNYQQIHSALIDEIRVFESKTRKLDYRSAIILAARYFLCSYIDEIIGHHPTLKKPWLENSLLNLMQGEKWGGERFFLILERASDDSEGHIDLLELGFLCLRLGFQGKYAKPDYNPREFEHLQDNLYTLIQRIRGEASSTLLLRSSNTLPAPQLKRKWKLLKFTHPIAASVLLVLGLFTLYLPYSAHLKKLAKPLTNKVTQIIQAVK